MEELRRRLQLRAIEERGSMLPYVVAGVFIITLIGYMLIGYLGDGYDESRQSKAAADAAALAAAESWSQALELEYTKALASSSPAEFWSHFGRRLTLTKGTADLAAEQYASNNDATVTSVSYNARTATVEVTVRGNDEIRDTGKRAEATASARIVFEGGICNSKGDLGVSIGGACATSPTSATVPDGFDFSTALKGVLPKTRTRLTDGQD